MTTGKFIHRSPEGEGGGDLGELPGVPAEARPISTRVRRVVPDYFVKERIEYPANGSFLRHTLIAMCSFRFAAETRQEN